MLPGEPLRAPFRFTRVPIEILHAEANSKDDRLSQSSDSHSVKSPSGVCISDKTNQHVKLSEHFLNPSNVDTLVCVTISNCDDCSIDVDVPCGALFIHGLRSCIVKAGGVQGSIQLAYSSKSTIEGFCLQLRITDSAELTIRVQTNSSTALVNCRGIQFGSPHLIESHMSLLHVFELVNLDVESYTTSEKWKEVRDFDDLSGSNSNWKFMET